MGFRPSSVSTEVGKPGGPVPVGPLERPTASSLENQRWAHPACSPVGDESRDQHGTGGTWLGELLWGLLTETDRNPRSAWHLRHLQYEMDTGVNRKESAQRQTKRLPGRNLQASRRTCSPVLLLAGFPDTVVWVVDCSTVGGTLHPE